ncbi:MAG: hypothetical protein ACD_63C00207G0001 [uncultured bacterium]|nr:MAG: hypothetical protein ACD_63C00207G0001 [uncultured bacterium]
MKKIYYYILVFLAIALVLLFIAVRQIDDDAASVTFFDIGQGDSALIRKGSVQVVIDGGDNSRVIEELGERMPPWDHKIEMIILSHPHFDHFVGLIDIFQRYDVEKFVTTGALETTEDFQVFLEAVRKENCEVVIADSSKDFRLSDINFDILFPMRPLQFKDVYAKNLNNTSIVLKVSSSKVSVLFTGDAEKEVEEKLLEENVDLGSDILKAGHHGSKTSSTEDFIKAVDPEKVIFSAGEDNQFNHPTELIVDRFQDFGVETLTTFEVGDVEVEL